MNKTAIQELIEKCGYGKTFDGKYMIVLSQQEVEELLEKEKEQIMEAFDYGDFCIDLPMGGWEQKYKSPEDYYNQKYNQKK
jgi:hypothetical protein